MGSEKKKIQLGKGLKNVTAIFIASGAFSGFFPVAPGTVGSAVGLLLVWMMKDLSWGWLAGASIALLVIGIWGAGETCQILKKKDASQVVIDEIVGMMITMIGIPVTPYWLVIGFLVFRLLDIVKPAPAKHFDEKVAGGFGVMMDDVIAGIYGNLLLHLMIRAQI